MCSFEIGVVLPQFVVFQEQRKQREEVNRQRIYDQLRKAQVIALTFSLLFRISLFVLVIWPFFLTYQEREQEKQKQKLLKEQVSVSLFTPFFFVKRKGVGGRVTLSILCVFPPPSTPLCSAPFLSCILLIMSSYLYKFKWHMMWGICVGFC